MSKKRILILMAGLVAVATLAVGGAACNDDEDDGGMASETPTADTEEITAGDLTITEPFARAMMDRGAVYFTVANDGEEDDAIVGASADVAATVELHETVTEGASTKMQPVEQIDVLAGGETTLEPGGLHVMLTELTESLAMGDEFTVEIEFERAGTVEFQVEVMSYTEETMGAEEGGM
ncbi:MAG: copper chaperone PCu(A)C [Dehalococcoidia bacterium]